MFPLKTVLGLMQLTQKGVLSDGSSGRPRHPSFGVEPRRGRHLKASQQIWRRDEPIAMAADTPDRRYYATAVVGQSETSIWLCRTIHVQKARQGLNVIFTDDAPVNAVMPMVEANRKRCFDPTFRKAA